MGPESRACSLLGHQTVRHWQKQRRTAPREGAAEAQVQRPLRNQMDLGTALQRRMTQRRLGPEPGDIKLDNRREPRLPVRLVGPVGSAGIGRHHSLYGLLGPAWAVGSVGLVALRAAGALAGHPAAAVGPSDDRPSPGGGLAARLSLFSSTTTVAPRVAYSSSRRTHWYSSASGLARAGRAPGLSAANTGSRVGVAGWPLRQGAAGDRAPADGF